MKEEIVSKLNAIRRTAEIILEHQSSKAFKNSVITVGAENIIGISKDAIDEIEKEKAPEPPQE
jgi:hypothetical protein